MDWNDLKTFLVLARRGALTGAGAALGVSASTVSRRVADLEAALGSSLFVRHPTGYLLTDEGQALLGRLDPVEVALASIEAGTRDRAAAPQGVVRLAAAPIHVDPLLVPGLPEFRRRFPGIRLEIASEVRTIGLSRREADLALRLSRPEQGNLVIKRLARQAHGLYAARTYLEAWPLAGDPPSLDGHAVVGWTEEYGHLPAAQWLARLAEGAVPALLTTSLATQLAAVRAGLGLAVLPCFCADAAGDLVRVIGPAALPSLDLWLVIHGDAARSARVRAVADFIAETIEAARGRIEARAAPPCPPPACPSAGHDAKPR